MVDFKKLLHKKRLEREAQAELDFRQRFDVTKPKRKNLKLWEASVQPEAGNGKRFSYLQKSPVKGGYRFEQVTMDPTRLTEREKEFWTTNDKSWAWHCFICGASVDMITEFVGGHPDDFKQWVRDVCSGAEECIWSGSFHGWKWTPRKDRLLLRMSKHRLNFLTACRLLGFDRTEVKARIKELT